MGTGTARSLDGAETQELDSSRPRDGDVVIIDARNGGSYGVRQVPGTVQFNMPQRERAVGFALDFARRHAVDAWCYNEHDGGYRLLEVFRREGGKQRVGRR